MLELKTIWSLSEAVNLAYKMENQFVRSSNRKTFTRRSNIGQSSENTKSNHVPKWSFIQHQSKLATECSNNESKANGKQIATHSATSNPYAKLYSGKCYRCNQPGHRSNDFRLRKQLIFWMLITSLRVNEDEFAENEYEGTEIVPGDEDKCVLCILQKLLLSPRQENNSRRHKIFRTRYTVHKKVCDLIIDSGSSENVVSKALG